jgi:voltage-gated potassium channel
MSQTLGEEIEKLKKKVSSLEKECDTKLNDELSVSLSINHGQYQTTIDQLEYKIDAKIRQIEDLEEKREKIEEIRLAKHLEQRQVEKLGSLFLVKLKDTLLFFLILFVLSLLATEVYRIGASGSGAEVQLVVEEGTIIDVQIINGGSEYEAVEISTPSKTGDSAIFEVIIQSRQIEKIDIVHGGSGYSNDVKPIVSPTFANSTLWMFWIIDTVCCVLFLLNFFFELRLCDSKKWYWKTHWVDFVTSIPLPPLHLIFVGSASLNAVRAGRVLRVIRILRAVRILRMFLFLWRGMDHLSSIMDVKLLKRSLFYGLIALLLGALFFMTFEQVQTGKNFGSSLWWSFTTLVTGGFADIHNPTSMGGKILTVMLVIGGMVLVGVFTATLTSVLVRDDDTWQQQDIDEQFRKLSKLELLVEKIDQRLDRIEENKNGKNPD